MWFEGFCRFYHHCIYSGGGCLYLIICYEYGYSGLGDDCVGCSDVGLDDGVGGGSGSGCCFGFGGGSGGLLCCGLGGGEAG